ncbi:MAG: hypothetical protein ABR964_05185 [Tepidisphaeraceae bacterium]
MISVDGVIARFRRDLALAALLRAALMVGAAVCLLGGPMLGLSGDGLVPLILIGAVWIVLSYRSMVGARLASDSPSLIAAGNFEQAEKQIDSVLRSFSLFRTAKLLGLHHLALLRHAQRRWRESALLCQALLGQRGIADLSRSTLLLMADSTLRLGDLRGTLWALDALYRQRLGLAEALALQLLQLDYGSRIGAWEQMLSCVGVKVQLSELMPSINAARSQAFLALAAYKAGRMELARWLRRRVELLADAPEIAADRPILAEMLAQAW